MIVAAALAAVLSFRVVPLACSNGSLAISGGGVLRLSPQGSCAGVVAGRAMSVTLDDELRAIPEKLDPASHPATELPQAAFTFAPAATAPEGADVTIAIVVTIPPATPAGSPIFLSTDRSSFSPAEIQMNQLDARRYRLQLPLHEGARLTFRVTRGTFSTIERDAQGRLPPPHIAIGHAGATYNITIAAWSDDT
jgi:hypothetical protein